MPQLNLNCPNCHRFVKSVSSKEISAKNRRSVGECLVCKIKILNLSRLEGNKWISSNEKIDDKAFNNCLMQFQPKKEKRPLVKERVNDFIKNKRMGVSKSLIQKEMNLKRASVNKAIRTLVQEKRVLFKFLSPYRYGMGKRKKYAFLRL